MIVLPHHSIVLITPPKCGSTSLHRALCSPGVGGIYVVGPQFWLEAETTYDKHTAIVPYSFRHMMTFVVVRDPYTRARSLWSHDCEFDAEHKDFDEFLESKLEPGTKTFHCSISTLLADCNVNVCGYWKLEHLDSCLKNHRVDADIPRLNTSRYRHGAELTPGQRARIADWGKLDFERFCYEK